MSQQESNCFLTDTESRFGVKKMEYIIISNFTVCGKTKGAALTAKDLLEAGANIDALINAGHIQAKATPMKPTQEGVIK